MQVDSTTCRAAIMGAVAGIRSQFPFAIFAWAARTGDFAERAEPPLGWLRNERVQQAALVSAAGEAFFDKLPFTPSRTKPAPLLGRLLFGGLAGLAVAVDAKQPRAQPVLVAAAAAVAAAIVATMFRRFFARFTRIPDPLIGVAEDAAAIALGLRVFPGLRLGETSGSSLYENGTPAAVDLKRS